MTKASNETGAVRLDKDEWPDDDSSHLVMEKVMGHYLKQRNIVLKKLQHAKTATRKSLEEIDQICERYNISPDSKEFEKIKQFDTTWTEIIKLFQTAGLTEDELKKIDTVLKTIPDAIQEFYDALVEQDSALLELIEEISSTKYKAALKEASELTKQIQSRTNPMSLLGPEEYDVSDIIMGVAMDAFLIDHVPRNRH